MPTVSVIMNCLNCARYLREAIDSVYAQTFKDWEIVFWDNASSDSSAEIVRDYDDRLRYFRGTETIPLGAARNEALKQTRGQFVAFLDCDDIWMPDKLQSQVPLFDDPEVGLVFSDAEYFDGKKSIRLYATRPYYTGWCFGDMFSDYFLNMQTVVIRHGALADLDEWFDPALHVNEEADLFIRIAYGWKTAMVDRPLARWRVHAASDSWTKRHLFAEEFSGMLDKYKGRFPDFEENYGKEIRRCQRQIDMMQATCFLSQGEGARARKYLYSHVWTSPKAVLGLLVSFLPQKAYFFLNRFRNRMEA
ncbi:MAG: glycosyltransferase [Proteobacteria bacterium]|nr:glycosyltransferase [Pseudomonadota bacterium]